MLTRNFCFKLHLQTFSVVRFRYTNPSDILCHFVENNAVTRLNAIYFDGLQRCNKFFTSKLTQEKLWRRTV